MTLPAYWVTLREAVLKEIKQRAWGKAVPVVAITA